MPEVSEFIFAGNYHDHEVCSVVVVGVGLLPVVESTNFKRLNEELSQLSKLSAD